MKQTLHLRLPKNFCPFGFSVCVHHFILFSSCSFCIYNPDGNLEQQVLFPVSISSAVFLPDGSTGYIIGLESPAALYQIDLKGIIRKTYELPYSSDFHLICDSHGKIFLHSNSSYYRLLFSASSLHLLPSDPLCFALSAPDPSAFFYHDDQVYLYKMNIPDKVTARISCEGIYFLPKHP